MDAKVATLLVTGVVAVGTLIYYLFFDNKNEPHHHGKPPSNRRSSGYVPEFREPPETRPSRSRVRPSRPQSRIQETSNNTSISQRTDNTSPQPRIQETSSNTSISRRTDNTSTPCYSTARTDDIRQTDNSTIHSDQTVRARSPLITSSQPELVSNINTETDSKPSTSDDRSTETISKSLTANVNSAKTHSKSSTPNDKSAETISKPPTSDDRYVEKILKPSTADDNSATAKTDPNDKSAETTSKPPTSDDRYAEITTNDESLNSTLCHSSEGLVNHSNSLKSSDDPAVSCSSTAQARSKSVVVIDRMVKKSSKKVHSHVDSANLNQQFCQVCGESAVMFQPCEHKVFCQKHVIKYMERAAVNTLDPLCPQTGCYQLINKFM